MQNIDSTKLVNGTRLLELLFDEKSRPSLRWLREKQRQRVVPYIKVAQSVFFDPQQVREALNRRFTVAGRAADV